MSRETKFRAWVSGRGMYKLNGFRYHLKGVTIYPIDSTGLEMDEWYFHIEGMLQIMQYTGLKDKNGKEIYEGDIILNKNGLKVFIEWNDLDAKFHCYDKSHRYHDTWTLGHFSTDSPKVIGNIYENPELLEENYV